MKTYIAGRLLQAIPVVILATFLVNALVLLLPGDPVTALMGTVGGLGATYDTKQVQEFRHELGLDKPIPVQYVIWLGHAVRGNLGRSTQTRRPVFDEVRSRLPVSIQLGVLSLLGSMLIGVPAGVAAAVFRNSVLDRVVTVFAVSGVALPGFWLAIMLILVFGERLRWLPPSGYVSLFDNPNQAVRHFVMPVFVLAWSGSAIVSRQTRSAMLEVLGQDYIRTARSKGLTGTRVIWFHGLRNALLAVVTVIGLLASGLIAGSVIAEQIFAIPGMGRLFVNAVSFRDIAVVQAVVLLITMYVVLVNLITDIGYVFLDPRIRFS